MDDVALQALFAGDAPPRQDTAFVLSVLDRIEKQRLRIQAAWMCAYAVAGAAVLYALSPVLVTLTADDVGNVVLFSALALASLWLVRRDLPGANLIFPA